MTNDDTNAQSVTSGDAEPAGPGPRGSSSEAAYALRAVERDYSRGDALVRAVRAINLDIAAGEMVALEGPSGSGKSTLLQLLGCLEVPSSGTISFFGRQLGNLSDKELTTIRSHELGFVFQQFNLIPTLSAAENVAIAMVPNKVRHEARLERSRELLGRVGLGHRLDHLPSRMSGGEQQRVAIARALANSPRVLIADEPTGNLDSETAAEVIGLIVELHRDSGVTIILATHDEEIATRAARRVKLRDGAITEDLRSELV
ncbi:MAG TPA: ABC transporter ATP-binding protein [Acidimicrobiales bacterium]|nr:ABC transporter ATP-binding protein [Acidimicrobiales bacterium]